MATIPLARMPHKGRYRVPLLSELARAAKICSNAHCPNVQPCPIRGKRPWEGTTRRKRLPKNWAQDRRAP